MKEILGKDLSYIIVFLLFGSIGALVGLMLNWAPGLTSVAAFIAGCQGLFFRRFIQLSRIATSQMDWQGTMRKGDKVLLILIMGNAISVVMFFFSLEVGLVSVALWSAALCAISAVCGGLLALRVSN